MFKWIASVSEKVLPGFMGINIDQTNSSESLTIKPNPRIKYSQTEVQALEMISPTSLIKRVRSPQNKDEVDIPLKRRRSEIECNTKDVTTSRNEQKEARNSTSPSKRTPQKPLLTSLTRQVSKECASVPEPSKSNSSNVTSRTSARFRKSNSCLPSPADDSESDFKKPSLKRKSTDGKRLSIESKPSTATKEKRRSSTSSKNSTPAPNQRTITSFFAKNTPSTMATNVTSPSKRSTPRKSSETNVTAKRVSAELFAKNGLFCVKIVQRSEKKVAVFENKAQLGVKIVPIYTKGKIRISNQYHKLKPITREVFSPRKSARLSSTNSPTGGRMPPSIITKPMASRSLNFDKVTLPMKIAGRMIVEDEVGIGSMELRPLPSLTPKKTSPVESSPSLKNLSFSPASNASASTSRSGTSTKTKFPLSPSAFYGKKRLEEVGSVQVQGPKRSIFGENGDSRLKERNNRNNGQRTPSKRGSKLDDCDFMLLNNSIKSPTHILEEVDSGEGCCGSPNSSSPILACMSPRATSAMTPKSRSLYSLQLRKSPKQSVRLSYSPFVNSTPVIRKRYQKESEDPQIADFFYHLNEIRRIRVEQWVNAEEDRERILGMMAKWREQGRSVKTHTTKWAAAWNKKKKMDFSLDEGKKRLVQRDITNGLENFPIAAYTYTESLKQPQFQYINRNKAVAPLTSEQDSDWTICCTCEGECDSNCECVTASVTGGCIIADKFMVTSKYSDFYNTFAVACGPKCKCRANCSNSLDHVVQNTKRFELFSRDVNMGFGVRTTEPMEANSILFEFQGEVITKAEHSERTKKTNPLTSSYSYMIYQKPGPGVAEDFYLRILKYFCPNINSSNLPDAVYIDPSRMGNIGRFFSHSEYPNSMCLRVIVNDARPEACRLFFYNTMPLRAGDEITFDYGNLFGMQKCLCGHLCCGDSGNHLLIQPKKRAYAMLNEVHANLYGSIRKFAEEELIKFTHDRTKFGIHYQKYMLLKARARKPLIPRRKKNTSGKSRNRRKGRKSDVKEKEAGPEQPEASPRERSPGTPSSTGSSRSDRSKENAPRVSSPMKVLRSSSASVSPLKNALRPRILVE